MFALTIVLGHRAVRNVNSLNIRRRITHHDSTVRLVVCMHTTRMSDGRGRVGLLRGDNDCCSGYRHVRSRGFEIHSFGACLVFGPFFLTFLFSPVLLLLMSICNFDLPVCCRRVARPVLRPLTGPAFPSSRLGYTTNKKNKNQTGAKETVKQPNKINDRSKLKSRGASPWV